MLIHADSLSLSPATESRGLLLRSPPSGGLGSRRRATWRG